MKAAGRISCSMLKHNKGCTFAYSETLLSVVADISNQCSRAPCYLVNFLSHEHAVKIGSSPVQEYYIVATFLMNVRNILYGNQFLCAIGPDERLRITLEEFLAMK